MLTVLAFSSNELSMKSLASDRLASFLVKYVYQKTSIRLERYCIQHFIKQYVGVCIGGCAVNRSSSCADASSRINVVLLKT